MPKFSQILCLKEANLTKAQLSLGKADRTAYVGRPSSDFRS